MNNKDVLNLKYKICDNLKYHIDDNQIVTLLEKQDHKIQKLLRKLNFNIPEYKEIELDEYCSNVFLMINAKNTVEDIGKNLENLYGDKVQPLYERLLVFLNYINVDCNYIERIN